MVLGNASACKTNEKSKGKHKQIRPQHNDYLLYCITTKLYKRGKYLNKFKINTLTDNCN
jgi:hypothetical protein